MKGIIDQSANWCKLKLRQEMTRQGEKYRLSKEAEVTRQEQIDKAHSRYESMGSKQFLAALVLEAQGLSQKDNSTTSGEKTEEKGLSFSCLEVGVGLAL